MISLFIFIYLVIHIQKPFLDKKSAKDIVNPWLGKEFDQTEIKQVMTTASMYIHHIATVRPDMNRAGMLSEPKP